MKVNLKDLESSIKLLQEEIRDRPFCLYRNIPLKKIILLLQTVKIDLLISGECIVELKTKKLPKKKIKEKIKKNSSSKGSFSPRMRFHTVCNIP